MANMPVICEVRLDSGIVCSKAKVNVLVKHEVTFVESADRSE
jgi:hypothetical protein